MKVAHVIAVLDAGGAEHALLRLARRCAARGVEQRVFALSPGGSLWADYEAAGLQPLALNLRAQPLRSVLRLVHELRHWRADVVQTWMYHADVVGGLAARCAGAPVAWGVRQTSVGAVTTSTSVGWMYRAARALSAHLPAAVVFNAQAASDSHRAYGYRHAVSHVIPNGLDVQQLACGVDRAGLRRELGLDEQAFLVGHLGRFTPEKDHATLLRAFARAAQDNPALHLVAAGRGVDKHNPVLRREIAALDAVGLAGRVHLLGERTDVARVLSGMDVFLLSSLHEGFPNALLEAMALGLPCITTDCGDAPRIAGQAARVLPRGNADALAGEVSALAALDAATRERIGAACAAHVAEQFGIDAMCQRFETVWREVARRPSGDNEKGNNHVRHRRTLAS